MHITCEQLLAKVEDRKMRCVAGFNGLSKKITGFTILDDPDILRWLNGGEFIVSIGYVTGQNRFLLKSLIPDLVQKGCVGLGIKIGAYYEDIPEEFIELGNKYHFPVIAISQSLRFTDIAFIVYKNMFDNELKVTDRMNLLYRKIASIVFSNTSIEAMLFNISVVIDNPVILLDKYYNLMAYENPETDGINITDIFPLQKGEPVLPEASLQKLSRKYAVSKFSYYDMNYAHESGTYDVIIVPINTDEITWGYFLIPTTMSQFNNDTYQIINSIKSVVGIFFLKNSLLSNSSKIYKNNFLNTVLLNNNNTDYNIRYNAKLFNFDYKLNRVCINLNVPNYDSYSYTKRVSIRETIDSIIERISITYRLKRYLVYFNDNFCFFLVLPPRHIRNPHSTSWLRKPARTYRINARITRLTT